ncbi:MAG: TolB family protein, partial [Gammaproteobacteria bacterium]
INVDNGRIETLNGWRLLERDFAGLVGWKIQSRRTSLPDSTTTPPPAIATGGITIYGAGSEQTRFRVTTLCGNFDFTLADLRATSKLEKLNGAVVVTALLASTKLTTDAHEEDFPSIAEAGDGAAWAVWPSFNGKADEIRMRRFQNNRWATFTVLPGVEGDVWKPQVAVDGKGRPWVVWSEQIAGNWDLYARALDGESWAPKIRLTEAPEPDINHHVIGDSSGEIHVAWQGSRNGDFNIYLRSLKGESWQSPVTVTEAVGNDWEPAVASDGKGTLAVVWDSYRNGDYDVFLRSVANGKWSGEVAVSASPYFEAHASSAIDKAGRIWVAWERGGVNWGKDQGYTIRSSPPGSVMGGQRDIRLRCYVNGQARQPAAGLSEALPPSERQFLQWPKLATDQEGRLWVHFRRRVEHRPEGAPQSRSLWQGYYTQYDGDRWTPAQ